MENIFVARFRKILEKLTVNLKDKYATINRNNVTVKSPGGWTPMG